MRRLSFLLIFGIGGAAILISLCVWQMQRLAWKEAVIARIEGRIIADPVPLPPAPDPDADAYLPVTVTGTLSADFIKVLVSKKQVGAGYRIVSAMDHPDGAILVDRGFVAVNDAKDVDFIGDIDPVTVTGNLQWPQETDGFTPAPDQDQNIWFARDVDAMASFLGTRPILLVQREKSGTNQGLTPMPVDTAAIPNDHLQYAITWFSLAVIWLAMTAFFLRRSGAAKQD
ncbi:MAG: SURF1 family protein [Sulfitobacter sp.]